MLRLLLALTIVLLPNALHFSVDTGIPGVNLTNLLFLLLCLGLAISGRDAVPLQRGRVSPAVLGLILVLMMGFLNTQLTDPLDLTGDVTKLKNAVFYPLLYFVYRRSRQDLRVTRQLILLTLAVAVIAGMEAVHQWWQFGISNYSPTERAAGPFGDTRAANRAGVFYAMFLPMLVTVFLYFRDRIFWRFAALAGCVILSLAIMATYSRQAYLIALIGVFLLLLRRNVLIAILLGALMATSVSLLPDSVTQRVMETQQSSDTGGSELDVSTASRFYIWQGAIQMWQDHPGGVGLNRFRDHIGDYTEFPNRDAHNAFVLMLAECGPLGLAALLWLFWRLWGLARRLRHSAAPTDPEASALALGFTLAVISMALGNLFSSWVLEGSVMGSFWILCGLLERYAALKEHATGVISARKSVTMPVVANLAERYPLLTRARPGYQQRE